MAALSRIRAGAGLHRVELPSLWKTLAWMTAKRRRFRLRRAIERIASPRRIVATFLAVMLFTAYALNAVLAFMLREPADPENLRLWLSGGMVLYLVYHCVRCSWSDETDGLNLTAAENLWLGGAPMKRSSLTVYRVSNLVVPTFLKAILLTIILARDVPHVELLVLGAFASLLMLETVRIAIAQWSTGLTERGRSWFRFATTSIAGSLIGFVLATTFASTPFGSSPLLYVFNGLQSLGDAAALQTIQWLSLPWVVSAQVAVTEEYRWWILMQLSVIIGMFALALLVLIAVDGASRMRRLARERDCWQNQTGRQSGLSVTTDYQEQIATLLARTDPFAATTQRWISDTASVALRHWVSVKRYRRAIAANFLFPIAVSLSPLLAGNPNMRWTNVVAATAFMTLMAAPASLRIDFRRDLSRMLLLRSLPIGPVPMVVGTLALPVMITWTYQWLAIAIAAFVTAPTVWNIVMWTAALNAIAVFTFAFENSLFFMFPHHERSEGIAMLIRAKLMFAAKLVVFLAGIALLYAWVWIATRIAGPWQVPAIVAGGIAGAWGFAMSALAVTARCWRRFDVAADTPPE